MSPTDRTLLGRAGEHHVRRHFERQGWTFVDANWQCRTGELDLVMCDDDVVVFIEVKMRRGEQAGRAEESVSKAQARRILATAERFLAAHPAVEDLIWRVDLVAITLDRGGAVQRLTHYPNAIVTG